MTKDQLLKKIDDLVEELKKKPGQLVDAATATMIDNVKSKIEEEYKKGEDAVEKGIGKALQGEITLRDLAMVAGGAKAATAALELFGVKSELLTGNLKGLTEAMQTFAGVGKQDTEILNVFSDVLQLRVGQALSSMATLLNTAAISAQKFQVELVKYGQDQSFQKSIAEQAQALSFLGIKYSELKTANIDLVKDFNASIRLSDKSKESFENNREALSQLSVFTKKFGIEHAETAKVMNFANDTMNTGTDGAIKLSETLLKFAESTGQNANTVFTQFNGQLDRFSVLSGEKAISTFERLQMTAKRTGQTLESVFNSVSKFDEIDEGFRQGGQINRVLSFMGGSFDTFKAMQASDEERAQMLYEAISGVADRYSQLNTDQAKRSMAKQIAESTGVDLKTVVGLLNKSTDLSRDMMDISKKPLVTEGYTDKERADKMLSLSTREDFQAARGELLETTKAVQSLANKFRTTDSSITFNVTELYKKLDDKVLMPIFTQQNKNIKILMEEFKKDAGKQMAEYMRAPGEKFGKDINKFGTFVDSLFKDITPKEVKYARQGKNRGAADPK